MRAVPQSLLVLAVALAFAGAPPVSEAGRVTAVTPARVSSDVTLNISATGLEGVEIDYAGPTVYVGPGAVQSVPVRIRVPRGSVQGGTDVLVSIEAVNRPDLAASGKARFIAPTD